jgi:hypothetical protein
MFLCKILANHKSFRERLFCSNQVVYEFFYQRLPRFDLDVICISVSRRVNFMYALSLMIISCTIRFLYALLCFWIMHKLCMGMTWVQFQKYDAKPKGQVRTLYMYNTF